MGINISLLGQMLTFGVLVWATTKYIWPWIINAMQERQNQIAEGLAAAERGQRELELAQLKSTEHMREAKLEAAKLLEQAEKRGQKIVEDAKENARQEAEKIRLAAKEEIEVQKTSAREALRREIGLLALAGAEKIMGQQLDKSANNNMIETLIAEVSGE